MTGYKSKRTAALDEEGMYLVHQTKHPKPAQQEPVAFCDPSDPCNETAFSWPGTARKRGHTTPLHTTPPQRKPLTIEYQSGYYDGKKAALAGREWNFCERCGKRTPDLTVIHTCTPPQENT